MNTLQMWVTKLTSFILSLCLIAGLLSLVPPTASANPGGGGSGTESDPWLISTSAQLEQFRNNVNSGNTYNGSFFKLTNNIELTGTWTPIGFTANPYYYFRGTFDGGGYTISGLDIRGTTLDQRGLFTTLDAGAMVKNLTVTGFVEGRDNIGGIVGRMVNGNISNCHFSGTVIGYGTNTGSGTGGVVGYTTNNAIVENCSNSGTVKGDNHTGGVVGYARSTRAVTDCRNFGDIEGSRNTGGIVGTARADVTNCYNTGTVTTTGSGTNANAGGIVGRGEDSSSFSISSCYNTGDISGNNTPNSVGGILGSNGGSSTIENCYNTGNITANGTANSDCMAGGISGRATVSNVRNCYNTGNVANTGSGVNYYRHVGGIVGFGSSALSNNVSLG